MARFVGQLSIDMSSQGESEMPWYLTGLPLPAFLRTAENRKPQSEEPFAQLANPRWIHADLQYLKDLYFYCRRQKVVIHPKTTPGSDAFPKRQPCRRPKAKTKAG